MQTNTTGSTQTVTCKPSCFKHKCNDCAYKDKCANAFKECYTPYVPYVPYPTYPTYPGPVWYYTTSHTNSGGE